jgi:hypothetical protein
MYRRKSFLCRRCGCEFTAEFTAESLAAEQAAADAARQKAEEAAKRKFKKEQFEWRKKTGRTQMRFRQLRIEGG